jgi:hypothetical protein
MSRVSAISFCVKFMSKVSVSGKYFISIMNPL